ncbi:MAG: glycosyltransferase [Paludibacter sp.]|nr:glycosyltransferase [Paludibacter sp.]
MISFVMLTWNRRRFMEMCLDSFYQNISENCVYQFLLIDNGSDDGTVEALKKRQSDDKNLKVIYNKRNKGLNEYKKLLNRSKGDYIIIIDDDVIEFPKDFDLLMVKYLDNFPDFGFLALDVIQNEHTNGGKPDQQYYVDIERYGLTISEGQTGGWCAILRRKEYVKIKFRFNLSRLNMGKGEDGKLRRLMHSKLNLRSGIIKNITCFHACGPYYSNIYGFIERDLFKFKAAKLNAFVDLYNNFKIK